MSSNQSAAAVLLYDEDEAHYSTEVRDLSRPDVWTATIRISSSEGRIGQQSYETSVRVGRLEYLHKIFRSSRQA